MPPQHNKQAKPGPRILLPVGRAGAATDQEKAVMHRTEITAGRRRVAETVDVWRERRRSRMELTRLSTYQLRDIGVSPMTAMAEASKPFWRA